MDISADTGDKLLDLLQLFLSFGNCYKLNLFNLRLIEDKVQSGLRTT